MKNKYGNKRLTLDLQNCYRIELTSNFANPTYIRIVLGNGVSITLDIVSRLVIDKGVG